MSTILFIAGMGIFVLIVCSKMPGLEHLVKPVIDLFFTFIKAFVENFVAWMIFGFKTIWYSHIEVLTHLTLSADNIDPTAGIKDK